MKPLGNDNNLSQPAKRASLLKGSATFGAVACLATLGLHAQDAPPSIYFPTTQEENVSNPEMRRWSPPRNLWPEQPTDVIAPELLEDPQNRVETKYTGDPNVKVKTGEIRGEYTDREEKFMQVDDMENDRPAELWPSVTEETGGSAAAQTVEYSEKVQYNSVPGAAGGYAEPLVVTPNRGDVQPTTYYITEVEEKTLQVDSVGETADALWAQEVWSADRAYSVYDSAPALFRPIDEVFNALNRGPAYDGNRARERYWNPQRYDSTQYFENPGQINRFYEGVDNNGFFGYSDRRGGLIADFGDSFGDRNRFTYEGGAGVRMGLQPLAYRNGLADAIIHVGPLALVDLSASASLLYTSIDGGDLEEGVDDEGFISILSLHGNFLLRVTESFYITAGGSLYYLPGTGDVGFAFGEGLNGNLYGNPLTFARINYEFELANWDWILYDEIAVGYDDYGNLFYNIGAVGTDGGEDKVGRYTFGNPARSTEEYGESGGEFALNFDDMLLTNSVGIMGTGLFAKDIRGIASLSHSNYWYLDDEGNDNNSDRGWTAARLRADYVSPVSRWHPYAEYTFGAQDDFGRMDHTIRVGVYADITENFSMDASVGYFWADGDDSDTDDSALWEVGLYHRISQFTHHSLRGGMVYYRDTFVGESYLSNYLRYNFYTELGPFTDLSFFGQIAETENIDFAGDNRTTFTAGARINREFGDYTDAYATVFYFNNDYEEEALGRTDGWVGQIGFDTQFLPKWYLGAFYRYTDQDGTLESETFTEHVVLATITRRF